MKRLIGAEIPSPVRQIDVNLKYVPKYLIQSLDEPFIWQIGDSIVTLNCRAPYVGWTVFREKILELIEFVKESNLVVAPYKNSLRYIDFIDHNLFPDLSCLKLHLQLGDILIKDKVQIRMELQKGESFHIIQIATNMQVNLSDQLKNGIIIDIDTYSIEQPNNWDKLIGQLDMLHDDSKRLFF